MTDYLRRRRMSVICNGPGSNNDSWYIIKGVLYQRSIQCGAFFCDKIIFDTFQFYFFIRYCFKTKKVYEHNKILPYKIRLMLHLICTFYFEFIQMITVWFCWFPFSLSIFFSWIAVPNVEIPIMFVWDDYFLYLLCYSTRCKCVIWLKLFDNQLSLN